MYLYMRSVTPNVRPVFSPFRDAADPTRHGSQHCQASRDRFLR